MKKSHLTLAIIEIVLSLLVATVEPGFGAAGVLLGILYIVFEKKKAAKAKAAAEQQREQIEKAAMVEAARKSALVASFSAELAGIPHQEIERRSPGSERRAVDFMPEIHLTNITRRTNIDGLFPLVIIDTETTGLSPRSCEIVELSAIKVLPGFRAESCFTTLIKPKKAIPAKATEVHGITKEMVADAPAMREVVDAFNDYIAGCNVVGHNVTFDLGFLYAAGVELSPKVKYYDTLDLAKKTLVSSGKQQYNHHTGQYEDPEDYDVEDYRLTTLCDHYGIYRDDAHRSLSDCLATLKILEHIIDDKTA